ncbi:LAFE_0B06612g1_1 [Lachancea fermentati]|uniref:Structural maintenance of chromosomes protein n=1 Tax=Lachancea fermentati TaxID=4955 RepID=A0A1G4M802_LACFM|nr:LAFE_0B06612g1_1 [Lachancea fermentati]
MGKLLGLELNNFKSYKGTVRIGFGDSNFTSIIGPNGSGKSNLMDAISFVLGVKSSHLRSHMLADLIYRGSVSQNADDEDIAGGGQLGQNPTSAYVKAFYSRGEDEDEAELIELTRIITNAQDSVYKIDGRTVSFKRYSEFLESENILIQARNFLVFQGDVEHVASQTPAELTKLLEQVSGSIQYKKEYERLKEELEKARTATSELLQSRKRAHAGVKSFKEGVNKDEEFRKQSTERENLQRQLSLWQLFHLESQRTQLTEKLKTCRLKSTEIKNKLASEEKLLQKSRTSYAKEEIKVTKRKTNINKIMETRDELNSALLPIKSSKNACSKRINSIERRIDSLKRDIERQEASVKQFAHQLKVVNRTKEAFEREIEEASRAFGKFKLEDGDLKEYETLKELFLSSGGSALEEKIALKKNDMEETQNEVSLYQKRISTSEVKINEVLNVEIEELKSQVEESTQNLNDKNSSLSKKVKDLKALQSKAESRTNKEYELNYKLREILKKLDDMNADQRESNKDRKLRENVSILKRLFPGVKGLVHDLCHPKKDKYAIAVSTVLGKNFDSVIVDSFAVAQECISYLKKQRAGIVSFIPLDTIVVSRPAIPFNDVKGCVLTIDAIEYENQFERAMQYVCSDSVICDNLSVAKDLKWNRGVSSKMVTLEGAIINRSGLMTGGVSRNSSNRWDKEEYQSLMSLKDQLLAEISESSLEGRLEVEKLRTLENEISFTNAEVSNLRTYLAQFKRAVDEKNTEAHYHNDLINNDYRPKLAQLQTTVDEDKTAITDLEVKRSKLQESIYYEFTQKVGFSISDYEKHSGEVVREQGEQLRQLQKQIVNVRNKLEFEQERLAATRVRYEKVLDDLKKASENLKSLENDEKRVLEALKDCERDLNAEQSEIDDLLIKLNEKLQGIKAMDESVEEMTGILHRCRKEKELIKEDIDKISLERANLLKNCRMLNIALPVISSSLDDLPMDKLDTATIEVANNIQVDYSDLETKYRQSSDERIGEKIRKSIREIDEILTILQPNSRAAERYEDAQAKYDAIFKETEKSKAQEKRVCAEFMKVKQLRKEAFEGAFNHVKEHIDPIYRDLTKDPRSTAQLAGGNASLTLDDEDEPYLSGIKYHATPPSKRFKDMEYLSGGEKTIAALALIFAINSFQPSPFFVLDEVDAALDISNVERIATYIRKHAQANLQFIVISLKNTMFEKSQSLVGVFRQQKENTSKVLTLNLDQYSD